MAKYSRVNFYKQIVVNNKLENDLVKNYWELFEIKRPLSYINLTRQHLQRPDLLSYSVYGDQQFWWIISKFNHIDDWWNDVEIGASIAIPNMADIDDWYINVLQSKVKETV